METLPFDIQFVFLGILHSVCDTSFIVMSHVNKLYHKCTAIYAINYHSGEPISRHVSSCRIAQRGYLDVLKWAKYNGYPMSYYMYHKAAINGHIEILEWAKQNCSNWNEYIHKKAVNYTYLKIHNELKLFSFTCERVTCRGYFNVLKWFICNCTQSMLKELQNNCRICAGIAYQGDIKMLRWARQSGFKWNYISCIWAAHKGQIEMLKWLKLNGCYYMHYVCETAALFGRLDVLQWARLNGCSWNSNVCAQASKMGHLHILKWARLNGCSWNTDTCAFAATSDHLEILQWARLNGCPWDSTTEKLAKQKWPNIF